jgi:UDP-N-acetyl-D-mannosaminuronic acid dehydrogenase
MPKFVAKRISTLLKDVKDPKVSLFGASYKENVGDTRESPTIAVIEELQKKKIKFSIHDPIADNFKYETSDLKKCLLDSDMLVLLVGHGIFKDLDLDLANKYMRNKIILDTKNFFDPENMAKYGFDYYKL